MSSLSSVCEENEDDIEHYYLRLTSRSCSGDLLAYPKYPGLTRRYRSYSCIEEEPDLESQAMRVVRTIGQAFDVCQQMSNQKTPPTAQAKTSPVARAKPYQLSGSQSNTIPKASNIHRERAATPARDPSPAAPNPSSSPHRQHNPKPISSTDEKTSDASQSSSPFLSDPQSSSHHRRQQNNENNREPGSKPVGGRRLSCSTEIGSVGAEVNRVRPSKHQQLKRRGTEFTIRAPWTSDQDCNNNRIRKPEINSTQGIPASVPLPGTSSSQARSLKSGSPSLSQVSDQSARSPPGSVNRDTIPPESKSKLAIALLSAAGLLPTPNTAWDSATISSGMSSLQDTGAKLVNPTPYDLKEPRVTSGSDLTKPYIDRLLPATTSAPASIPNFLSIPKLSDCHSSPAYSIENFQKQDMQPSNSGCLSSELLGCDALSPGTTSQLPGMVLQLENFSMQLLRGQLEQAMQSSQVSTAQVQLLRDQLTAETAARLEAQTRTQELLAANQELLDQVSVLVSRLQELESSITTAVHQQQVTLLRSGISPQAHGFHNPIAYPTAIQTAPSVQPALPATQPLALLNPSTFEANHGEEKSPSVKHTPPKEGLLTPMVYPTLLLHHMPNLDSDKIPSVTDAKDIKTIAPSGSVAESNEHEISRPSSAFQRLNRKSSMPSPNTSTNTSNAEITKAIPVVSPGSVETAQGSTSTGAKPRALKKQMSFDASMGKLAKKVLNRQMTVATGLLSGTSHNNDTAAVDIASSPCAVNERLPVLKRRNSVHNFTRNSDSRTDRTPLPDVTYAKTDGLNSTDQVHKDKGTKASGSYARPDREAAAILKKSPSQPTRQSLHDKTKDNILSGRRGSRLMRQEALIPHNGECSRNTDGLTDPLEFRLVNGESSIDEYNPMLRTASYSRPENCPKSHSRTLQGLQPNDSLLWNFTTTKQSTTKDEMMPKSNLLIGNLLDQSSLQRIKAGVEQLKQLQSIAQHHNTKLAQRRSVDVGYLSNAMNGSPLEHTK